eukprot:62247-Pleurochrysis_carterae.AAC.1
MCFTQAWFSFRAKVVRLVAITPLNKSSQITVSTPSVCTSLQRCTPRNLDETISDGKHMRPHELQNRHMQTEINSSGERVACIINHSSRALKTQAAAGSGACHVAEGGCAVASVAAP